MLKKPLFNISEMGAGFPIFQKSKLTSFKNSCFKKTLFGLTLVP